MSDKTVLPVDGTARPTLDIRAGVDLTGITIPGGIGIIGSATFPGGIDFDTEPFDSGIVLGQVDIVPPNGLIFLTNQYFPNTTLSNTGVVITGKGVTRIGAASPLQGIDARGFGGNGSSVIIDSRGIIALREGASIDSSSNLGNAGDIKLTAGESISLDPTASLISSTSTGRSGDINLNAKEISLDVFASVITQGGGNIQIKGDRLLMQSFSQVTNPALGKQNAGNIFIQTNDSVNSNGGNIATFVIPGASGKAGNIDIKTGELSIVGDDLTVNGRRFTGGYIASDTSGDSNAGNITIDARRVSVLNGAQIRANAGAEMLPNGKGNGGNVNVHASELVEVSGTIPSNSSMLSKISADTFDAGAAGNVSVIIDNGDLIVRDQGDIQSQVQEGASGKGGNVALRANNILLESGGQVAAGTFGTGQGGALTINAGESVKITGIYQSGAPSGLFTATYGDGDAGDLTVTTNQLRVQDGGTISTSTAALSGQGRSGNLTINAPQSVEVTGSSKNAEGDVFDSSLVAETGRLLEVAGGIEPALGGKLTITTGRLSIRDGARVSTNTYNLAGRAGDLVINASEAVEVAGKDPDGSISSLSAKTNGIGNAGNLTIHTGQLSIRGGAEVSTSTSRDNDELHVQQGGQAGTLNVTADTIEVGNGTSGLISSSLLSTGDAGQINLNTRRLIISNGGTVSTASVLGGRGGDLNVTATESIFISGKGLTALINDPFGVGQIELASNISTDATSLTDAGSLVIHTGQLIVQDGAEISARTGGLGNAGTIRIQADSITLMNGGLITSQSSGLLTERGRSGNAGNIFLNVRGLLQANDGTISTSATRSSGGALDITARDIRLRGNSDITTFVDSGAGGGGNITLTAKSIVALSDSDILSFARDGQGGNINLNTRAFFGQNYRPAPAGTDPRTLDGNNRVDVNASGTVSGIITIPDTTFIQNGLTQLAQNLIDPNTLLANSCIVRNRQQNGRFFITGSGGLPVRPGDAPLSSFPTGDVRSLPEAGGEQGTPQSRSWKPGDPIVEPQGIYRLANGRLVMSRECEP